MNQIKDHRDMKLNARRMLSTFVNKKSISFHAYFGESQFVAGIVIIENPCCSIEESKCKPVNYEVKFDYVYGGCLANLHVFS